MRKLIALFFVFTLLCSLCACKGNQDPQSNNSSSGGQALNINEILLFQAHRFAQQVGMAADSNYMKISGADSDIISRSKVYTSAIDNYPSRALIARNTKPNALSKLYATISKTGTSGALTCMEMLRFEAQFSLPGTLATPITVLLQYGDQCSILVHFEPAEGNLTIAHVIPIPAASVDAVINQHMKSNKVYTAKQFADNADRFTADTLNVDYTGSNRNTKYYEDLAKLVFSNTKQLSAAELQNITTNEQLIAQTAAFSKAITGKIASAHVYDISAYVLGQSNQIIRNEADRQDFEQWITMRVATALPATLCSEYGSDSVAANTLLSQTLTTNAPGAAASEQEVPVLVVLELTNNMSVVLVLCPGEHHTYHYSFACLPVPFDKVHTQVTALGAVPMK